LNFELGKSLTAVGSSIKLAILELEIILKNEKKKSDKPLNFNQHKISPFARAAEELEEVGSSR
jgi:hypothetical protein